MVVVFFASRGGRPSHELITRPHRRTDCHWHSIAKHGDSNPLSQGSSACIIAHQPWIHSEGTAAEGHKE